MHFERMATERGLPVRVAARGLTPKDAVPQSIVTALAAEGFDVSAYQPTALGVNDLAGAEYVVTFGVAALEAVDAVVKRWDHVSALSENYPKARDEVVALLKQLLAEIGRDVEARKHNVHCSIRRIFQASLPYKQK